MPDFYTFSDSPDRQTFAALCTPDFRIKAIIGVKIDHLITSPLIDIATTILCPGTPGLEKAKFKPVGAVNGSNIVLMGIGEGFTNDAFGDLVLLEVDADAQDVLDFYRLDPGAPAVPNQPMFRLVNGEEE